jgi:signal transduction histidine kinase
MKSGYRQVESVMSDKQTTDKTASGTEQAQQTLLNSLPHALLLLDADNRIVAVNDRAAGVLMRRSDAIVGKPVASVLRLSGIGSRSRIDLSPVLQSVRSGAQPEVVEKCFLSAKGVDREVTISLLPASGGAPDSAGVTLVIDDSSTSLPTVQMRDAVLSMVSHELRTPLLHIKGFVSSLLESDIQWDEETRMDFLHTIDREADRLTAMVSDLMEISRMGSGELPLHIESADLYQLSYAAVDEASPFLRRHRVVVNVPETLPHVNIDGLRMIGVLVNLIENATKYSEEKTTITLDAEERGKDVVFSVSDQGPGIPEHLRDNIFEMFFRGQHGKGRPSGTGLGLAVCRAVVEAHHGKIWVESSDDGSTFYFTMPLSGGRKRRAQQSGRSALPGDKVAARKLTVTAGG